jgi:uncharacterized RDD family membrane protein YckC
MDWYYADTGRQVGPVDEAAFNNLVSTGIVRPDTLVWHPGMPTWQAWRSVQTEGVAAPAPGIVVDGVAGTSTRFCTICGRPFPPDELVAFGSSLVCASCKDIYAQRLREGLILPSAMRYGGFWIRFAAVLIDSVLLYIIMMLIALIGFGASGFNQSDPFQILRIQGLLLLLQLGIAAAYETWFVGRFGATPGKMTCRLKVVNPDATPISYARALGRHFAKIVSGLTISIGYIIAAFDDEKRALHDRICETRVIKT